MNEANNRLNTHASFFTKLINESGSVEYFIGWFGESNIGLTLDPELMSQTAELGIAVSLDVYPNDDNETAS